VYLKFPGFFTKVKIKEKESKDYSCFLVKFLINWTNKDTQRTLFQVFHTMYYSLVFRLKG